MEDKKYYSPERYQKYREKTIQKNLRYQQKFAHVSINMPKELREAVREYAEANGTSMQRLVNEYLASLVGMEV